MKYSILLLLSVLFLTTGLSAQNEKMTDKQAMSILDRFSSAATSAPSVSIKFKLITDDQLEKTTETIEGSVILSKNSYRLDLPDNIIWYNGDVSWSYLPAEKEVTITKPDKKDNSFQSKPSAIFNMHKNGYRARLIEEKPDSYVIDLYPEDIKSDLIRVRLAISKPALSMKSLEYKRKDGITLLLNVTDYNLKQAVDAATFSFVPEKYKGVDIIDMR